ncbi:MAG: alpha/beta hydrolase [Gemmatimonadota bacterium]|nr:MAG: alpha/beta hydrolase [Gemmatimonadota bacterium]
MTTGTFEGVGATRLAWHLWEAEDASAIVVIVHGLGDHAGRYDLVAESLVARGFTVFGFDQRGHGRSQGIRGHARSFGQLREDLGRAIREARSVSGGLPLFLWGHSMGGLLVIRHLQGDPGDIRGAVITSPWLATRAPVPEWKRFSARILDRIAPWLALSTGLVPEMLMRDADRIQAYREDRLVHDRISPRLYHVVLEEQKAALANADRFDTPGLFLVPQADPLVVPSVTKAFAEAIQDGRATVVPLPGLLHEPHNEPERGDVFLAAGDWIDQELVR